MHRASKGSAVVLLAIQFVSSCASSKETHAINGFNLQETLTCISECLGKTHFSLSDAFSAFHRCDQDVQCYLHLFGDHVIACAPKCGLNVDDDVDNPLPELSEAGRGDDGQFLARSSIGGFNLRETLNCIGHCVGVTEFSMNDAFEAYRKCDKDVQCYVNMYSTNVKSCAPKCGLTSDRINPPFSLEAPLTVALPNKTNGGNPKKGILRKWYDSTCLATCLKVTQTAFAKESFKCNKRFECMLRRYGQEWFSCSEQCEVKRL